MAYLAPIHRPSSVRHAIKLNLLQEDEECLVVAKSNRIEIWQVSGGALHLHHTQSIHGKISMLDAVQPPNSSRAHLYVGTERYQYFTLGWNQDTNSLDTIATHRDGTAIHMRDSQSLNRCSIDPTGRHIIMELFEGVLSVLEVEKSTKRATRPVTDYLSEIEQIRITELFIRSSTFLRSTTNIPKYAILYTDGKDNVRLATYRLSNNKGGKISDFDPDKDRENDIGDLDPGASMLIPVPQPADDNRRYLVRNASTKKAQMGGVIIVGESILLYLDDESKATVQYEYKEAMIFVAWVQYDDRRFLLGDDYGNLHLLTIQLDGADVVGMDMNIVAVISKPSQLVYLGNGLLYVASHEGDSQLFEIDPSSDVYVKVQTFDNIAPILDFTVMDMGNRDSDTQTNEYSSGQARIVTGSGSFQTGSLRSVRSGVGLEDIVLLEDMHNIRDIFALKGSAPFGFIDTLVISFITETRIFYFDSEGQPEEKTDFLNFQYSDPTLLARNVQQSRVLQVTPSTVSLIDADSGTVVSSWTTRHSEEITAVSANDAYVLLAVEGKTLICLDLAADLQETAQQTWSDNEQVACVHIPDSYNVAMVGFWQGGSLSILDLRTLVATHVESLRLTPDSAAIPRDIVMAQLLPESVSGPTLLVAMSDGYVQTFTVDIKDFSLSGKKSVVLGTQQPKFQILPRADGVVNVFATCEHASLIYGAENRIVYSAVTAEDATCVCYFDSEAYPDTVVLATATDLKISKIDDKRRTHVNTLQMNEVVRRIAYSPSEKVFGLGTIKQTLSGGIEEVTSSFRLVDEVVFQDQGQPYILNDHPGTEIVETVTKAEFIDSYGKPAERFIVGTSFLDEESGVRGRILIFGIDSERNPYILCTLNLKGACRCVAILDGMIVAALVKTVVMYSYTETTTSMGKLTKEATYRTSTLPIDLAITDDGLIVVADLMKSISLVEYKKGVDGLPAQLVEVARHFQSCWSTAVSHIEGDSFLEADADGNLIVLSRNREGLTHEDKIRLQVTGEINLGEQVNRIRKISVYASKNAMVVPHAFLATIEGSLYLFGTIASHSQSLLLELQSHVAEAVVSPGDIAFNDYRAFKNVERETAEPFRFVDGELLERYLDFAEDVQESIAGKLGKTGADVRGIVEELKRLH